MIWFLMPLIHPCLEVAADVVTQRMCSKIIDKNACSFDQIVDDIYPEVVSPEEQTTYPPDTIFKSIAGVVRIAYFVDVSYINGTQVRWPISQADIMRWKVPRSTIEEICANDECIIPVQEWDRIGRWGIAYQYPVFDCGWTYVLLNPLELTKINLNGPPLVMILEADCAIVTGARDYWGVQTLISRARNLNPTPLTPRPLMLTNGEWILTNEGRLSALISINRLFRRWAN